MHAHVERSRDRALVYSPRVVFWRALNDELTRMGQPPAMWGEAIDYWERCTCDWRRSRTVAWAAQTLVEERS